MIATTARMCFLAIAVLAQDGLPSEPGNPVVERLLALHNHERALKKLPALTLSDKLCESADAHARDLASHLRLSHTGSDGSHPGERANRVGYIGSVGENVAGGVVTPEQAVFMWMKSPGHRENILGRHVEMGAALAISETDAPYWCVVFGRPRSSASPVARAYEKAEIADRVNDEAAAAFVRAANLERKAADLAPLKVDVLLARSARTMAVTMAAKNSAEIGDPRKLVDAKAVKRWEIRVKSAAGIPTPQEAARQLVLGTPEELAAFREVGVGYALTKDRAPYWCVIFAKTVVDRRPSKSKPK